MKYALALLAALALSVPAFAQETETLPDGQKVRIHSEDNSVIIEVETEKATEEGDLPEELQEIMKRFREQMEEMRKDMEERMKKVREEMEKKGESHTGPDGEEVEEYEHKSADGKVHVKVKIVRIRKTSGGEGETPKAPEEPKKEAERKQ